MEDTQESKSKNPYLPWSTHETKTLLRLLVDGVNQNWADQNGSFSKLTVEQRILPELNRICGSKKTLLHYRNQTKILRGKYKSYADLLRFSSGFGWDSETKRFTAPDEVWEEYFKGHRKDKHLRDNSFEDYEDLHTIYGKNVAIGKNAMGLGDATDARTYGVENSEWDYQGGYTPQMIGDNDEDDDNNDGIEQVISSSSRRNANGKLPIRKKARTERFNVEKISDEISAVTGMNNQMFSMIQQRWQKEAEEKQAEEKNDNVWDAIKEVPDLEENERFDAMNLVHQLGIKAGFGKMTIDERRGWIKRSVHKP